MKKLYAVLYFPVFFLISLNAYTQTKDSTGQNKTLFHKINFSIGLSTQFLLKNPRLYMQPHKTHKRLEDPYEMYNTQFIYYNFDFRIYKNFYFSFTHGFMYDHYSQRVFEYEPHSDTEFNDIFDVSRDIKSLIFHYGYGLSYLFHLGNGTYKLTYSINRRIAPQNKNYYLLYPIWGSTLFYAVDLEEFKLERYFDPLVLGVSYQYNGTSVSANRLHILSFYLGYRIKSW